ncbi:monocarboxylate permease-like protein [Acephala macrosclerotiorum]|nr:monocarboxylate permease-like protein [Acephala macrosclerotiorum]
MDSEKSRKSQDERQNSMAALEWGHESMARCGRGRVHLLLLPGILNAFGLFEEYYLTYQLRGQSPDNIAWIGSTSAFLQFFAGMFGGPMFDRFGAKVVRPAVAAYVFALMMLSLCKDLRAGILIGLVIGFLQIPAFAAVSQYFDKKRAAAFDIAVSGSSTGGVIIPIALSKMLNSSSLRFRWSARVIGFLITPFLGFACVAIKSRLSSRKTDFWILAAFKDIRFNLLIFALFFMFIGMWTPLFYILTYAVSRGMSSTLAGYLLAIINAASTFGRVISGVLADKYGRLNIFGIGGIMTGILVFCMDSAHNNTGIIVYSVVFGFFSGTIISGAPAAFSVIVEDTRDMGTYMGMGMAVAGLGGLIGPPVNGAFVERYGEFSQVSMFSGSMCIFGGFIALSTKVATTEGILGKV